MTQKKYTISLDGLLSHESIIFKLICSVSERTKNRINAYAITTDNKNADININDIKNKQEQINSSPINVWVSDKKEDSDNALTRPLIATRVLHTLDKLIKNIEPSSDEVTSDSTSIPDKTEGFSITEEEASELAIVHDDILENPANKEEPVIANNIELTLIKNEQINPLNTSGIQRVLVVDDSSSVRKQLELELDLFNVSVDFAESASSAFSLLNSNTYDLALLDVVLPDKDGFQICKHIKAECSNTIAIMLTGKATQADKIKGALAGCNDYLIKPVGRITFQNAVKNFIPLKTTSTAIEA